MLQSCSCQGGTESELRLDNGRTIRVRRMRDTFLEFQAMGMPANDMVGDLLAQRISALSPLAESERPAYRASLLREYSRLVQARQGVDRRPRRETTRAPAAVEIFSKPTCPYTRGLRRKLDHDRVTYVEYDVQSDPAKLKLMLELNGGQRNVPTVRQGDEVTVGFHGR